MAEFFYYWCRECDFDTVLSKSDLDTICPLCAGDNGRSIRLRWRPVKDTDGPVEGIDERMTQT